MSKKNISDVVSATGLVAHFVTELVREVKARGGTDEQIHAVMTNRDLIKRVADVAIEPIEESNFAIERVELATKPGGEVMPCIFEAVQMARRYRAEVRFIFNDLPVIAQPDSNPGELYQDWYTRMRTLASSQF